MAPRTLDLHFNELLLSSEVISAPHIIVETGSQHSMRDCQI